MTWGNRFHFDSQLKRARFQALPSSALAYELAGLFQKQAQNLLIVASTREEALQIQEDLEFFLGDSNHLLFFPHLDVLPYFQLSPHPDLLIQRVSVLAELLQTRSPKILITTLPAILRKLPPKSIFNDYSDYLVAKEEMERDQFLLKLQDAGYLSVPLVEEPGTFAVRGGVVDVFAPHTLHPCRLEFFGDRLESLRFFNPVSQKSVQEIAELVLLPAREIILNEKTVSYANLKLRERFDELGLMRSERDLVLEPLKNRFSFSGIESFLNFFYEKTSILLDYLSPQTLCIYTNEFSIEQHAEKLQEEVQSAFHAAQGPEKIVKPSEILISWKEWLSLGESFSSIFFGASGEAEKISCETHETLKLELTASSGVERLEKMVSYFREKQEKGKKIIFIAGNETQKIRLKDLFTRHQFSLQDFSSIQSLQKDPASFSTAWVGVGHLSSGFSFEDEPWYFVTDAEIFGGKARRKKPSTPLSEAFSSFEDLKSGDYVVHAEHGVCLYKGLVKLDLREIEGEFLQLEFLGGDKLYLPVYRLGLISRYMGEGSVVPELDKLGGAHWLKTQEKVKKKIRVMASELLKIYAARAAGTKKPFGIGGEVFEEFEAAFPYEETPDQGKAIEDVIRDMESSKPMDRLVCGDVGYGKTEVALRGSFKAVLDNRQVAVLVPTTILAFQHFENFQKRLSPYGVKIGMLSRFRSPAEQKTLLKEVEQGQVDVVIGTHRLLQNDIQFKNLGLLVIDEEHRFGVAHKERIKKMRNLVDVLTLTATPIPRTLNLSLFGIRDLSIINTPPLDREAIRTFVARFDESLIREAILRELKRGGQVFFVHNRVQSIHAMRERLEKLVPEAKITVAHGQMEAEELEETMLEFFSKKTNLLLCTSIIESGIDFPSANTILIHRADRFGLAQLYQLRGRVGRSNVQAYCYLLIPAEESITEDARSRLNVLQRFTELGSGFKIAAHDLEIRGAGNILGGEQHGQITAVGYEMYMRLLEETLAEMKGEQKSIEIEPELNFMIPAVLPDSYIPDASQRLGLYKRISNAADEEALESLKTEIEDRFGKMPDSVHHLLGIMRIRLIAKRLFVESIHQEKTRVIYKFHSQTPVPPEKLLEFIKKDAKNYQLTPDFKWVTPLKEILDEKILEHVYKQLVGLES